MKKKRKTIIPKIKTFKKNKDEIVLNNNIFYSLKPYKKLLNTWKGHKRGLNYVKFTLKLTNKYKDRKWLYKLNVKGIGFKVFYFKKEYLAFDLGYSSLILYKPSTKISIILKNNYILLYSENKNLVSNAVYAIINLIPRDNYKGKGIYLDKENVKLKKIVK